MVRITLLAGTDRNAVSLITTDPFAWPTSYTVIFDDVSNAIMNPAGGFSDAGTLVVIYAKYLTSTQVYNNLSARRSTDDGTTWGR